jgi:hypothetical protein
MKEMFILISTIILIYLIDAFLVGVSFFSLRDRFQWRIFKRMSLIILFIAFAFLENYILPVVIVLDLTYTVGNTDIAKVFDLKPNEHFAKLFGFSLFEIIVWAVQSLLAAVIGEMIIGKKSTPVV